MKRYPLQALADALGVPLPSLGSRLGVSGSTWQEYRDRGVSERVADRLAAQAGLPVLSVWPEMIDDAIAASSLTCPECETTFIPSHPNQRYCSPRCRKKVSLRNWRRSPAGREWERNARRRRYAETGDYDRAYARARHHANREQELERNRQYRLRKKAQSTGQGDGSVAA